MSATNNTHPYTIKAPLFVSNTTNSSSTSTGALITNGGFGVGGTSNVVALTAGGLLTASNGLTSIVGTTNLKNTTFAGSSTLNFGSNVVTTLAAPSSSTDGATKTYVDGLTSGLNSKYSVIATTTANGTLNTAYENGDTIDGVTLATGNRILLKNQTTATENGIYVVAASGSPTRATDFAASASAAGAFVFIQQGTTYADTGFLCTNDTGSDVVGTNNLAFVQFSSAGIITAGTGLTKTGNTLSVNASQTQITQVGSFGGTPLTTLDVSFAGSATNNVSTLQSALATSNVRTLIMGQNNSANDASLLQFYNIGGSGSASNKFELFMAGYVGITAKSTNIEFDSAIKNGNEFFKVRTLTGTLPAAGSSSSPSLPSGVTYTNCVYIEGVTNNGTDTRSFTYAGDALWLVDIFVNNTTVSITTRAGATSAASQAYRITFITTN